MRAPAPANASTPFLAAQNAISTAPKAASQPRAQPTIEWKQYVGHCARRNAPTIVGIDLFIATAGDVWNEPDEHDGICRLNAEIGGLLDWWRPTPADANRVVCMRGVAVTGCDDGTVLAVRAGDGGSAWSLKLESGVVGGPVKLPGAPSRRDEVPIALVEYIGKLHLINILDGALLQTLDLGRNVLAEFVVATGDLPGIVGGSQLTRCEALIHIVCADGGTYVVPYGQTSNPARMSDPLAIAELRDSVGTDVKFTTSPVLAGSTIIVPYARDTTYSTPPLTALRIADGSTLWDAADPQKIVKGFGNIRAAPIPIGDELVFATAYTDALMAVSAKTGAVTWAVDLGAQMFEQWSGAASDGASIYIGRHDGYLHKIDYASRRREWSLYLGQHEAAGALVDGEQPPPRSLEQGSWRVPGASPILATPVLGRGRLYVGTGEGWLYCIGNLGV